MMEYSFERSFWILGKTLVAGIDEAGRGPLAGPVVAAAVILPPEVWIDGVDDSKKLTPGKREELFGIISRCAVGIGVGIVSPAVIDRINIYQATMKSMADAVLRLHPQPDHLLIDGPRYQQSTIPFTTIVDGDARCYSIAAASIIAKVTRDRLMRDYDRQYPAYGFAKHKGYGTPEHLEAIKRFGPCEIHRRSFRMPARETGANAD